ncbi:MAG: hypothetical protein MdMp014T_2177 [Treponematales bacterium]
MTDDIGPEDREIQYYYSRERRLQRAPRAVRELYEETPKRRGFLTALAPTRAHVFMLLSILLASAMMLIASRVSSRNTVRLGGAAVTVEIARETEGDGAVLTLRKTLSPKEGRGVRRQARRGAAAPAPADAYTGEVDIAVSPVFAKPAAGETAPEAPPLFSTAVFFTLEEEEEYRVALPREFAAPKGSRFIVMLQTANERVSRVITGE